ncbi:MAG: hypothetical protein J7K72_02110 [Candidatus Aenigmarchaeota archaeon]|nr:hypothetical protein [Candidatus Aenigmarchaeota archaeon]
MQKLKTCNVCGKKFKPGLPGRLQIVKKKKKGKVEIWVCPDCAKEVKKRLEDLELLY